MVVKTAFDIGEIVYLKTDPDQFERLITNIQICPGVMIYTLSFSTITSNHYELEISRQKDVLKSLNLEEHKEN